MFLRLMMSTNWPTSKLFASLFIFLLSSKMAMAENTTVAVNVGVAVDLETWIGKMGLSCINMALSDFYASNAHYKTRLLLHTRDTKKDVVGAAAAAVDLIKNAEVKAIIGPITSMQASFVIDLGEKAKVPIISFSATSPSLDSIRSSYFFRATQEDSFQVKAISAIVQYFGWREVVPIYVDNECGEAIVPFLADALQEVDARIPYRSVLHPQATDDQIGQELYRLMTMPTRVFIVHMFSALGSRLFTKAKEIGMMGKGYVWIITDGVGNALNSLDSSVIDSMQGVLGVKTYVQETKEVESFRTRWKREFGRQNPTMANAEVNIYGLWAYDAAVVAAMAVEKVGAAKFGFHNSNLPSSISTNTTNTDLETFGVSEIGPQLGQALANTKFKGLTGDFHLLNQQLQPLALQIINVNGNGGRGIGFWTVEKGLTKKLMKSSSKNNLGSVIWPGDSTAVPKGWEIPTNGKRLRVGVPIKESKFVNVSRDPSTNKTTVTGYCIDVFKAVTESMPYAITYDFVTFPNSDGKMASSCDELIAPLKLGEIDAVVGDTTIIANRSKYVDFTLPYTESRVYMIVPIKDENKKNAWVFLKPLTWDLWVTSGCFFIFIGFVVWVLEHQINEDFRGPPFHQVGTSFWFSFSTMVFAYRESVVSNLARFVVIVWVFVVLILTQSYTASLASLLTVQQLQPTVTDVKELIRKGENVGYQDGSFVYGILKGLGFQDSHLNQYASAQEFHEAFSKGTANGGIAAAFDEVPYAKLFLSKYCSKYTMIEPNFKTAGFGFMFPKGSPLVPDVSRAILTIIEGDKIKAIEKAWFGHQTTCPDTTTHLSSRSLGLDSFSGLFLITSLAGTLALLFFAAAFFYKHSHILTHPTTSVPTKFALLFTLFLQRDLTAHTFRNAKMRQSRFAAGVRGGGAAEASPHTNGPPSPSTDSNQRDSEFWFFGDQQGAPPAAASEDELQEIVVET